MSEIYNLNNESFQTAAKPDGGGIDQFAPLNNPSRSLRLGLLKLYDNYLQIIADQQSNGLIDEEKAEELIGKINELSLRDIGIEDSKSLLLELAKETMGAGSFFGPDEIRKAGIEIKEDLPPIPFSTKELERARELGQILIYRTNTTIEKINDISRGFIIHQKKVGLHIIPSLRKSNPDFTDPIREGWALVTKENIPGTEGQDFLHQTSRLLDYLIDKVFQKWPIPERYEMAARILDSEKEIIKRLLASRKEKDWRLANNKLATLAINRYLRQTPAEYVYDGVVYYQNTGELLHKSGSTWTASLAEDDRLIEVSSSKDWIIDIKSEHAWVPWSDRGTTFSRRF